jgi:hypothetical protein
MSLHEILRSPWSQTVLWTIGFPLLLAALFLTFVAIARRYAKLIETVPDDLRPSRQRWFREFQQWANRHPFRVYSISYALWLVGANGGRIGHLVFSILVLVVASAFAGWALWGMASGRAHNRPARAYCLGLLVFGGCVAAIAVLLNSLPRAA